MQLKQSVAAVIPAAGIGSRMGLEKPKQYLKIGQQTILEHSVSAMANDPRVAAIYIAVAAEDPYINAIEFRCTCPVYLVIGGATRAESVLNGVKRAQTDGFQWVAVHDAARPCLTQAELTAVIDAGLFYSEGAILALPLADTLKRAKAERVAESVNREALWRAQTPQVFRTEKLVAAIEELGVTHVALTDESSAMELAGQQPRLVRGRQTNLKITEPGDERLAALYLELIKQESPCV